MEKDKNRFWTFEKKEEYIKNLNDSSKWDIKMLREDIKYINEKSENPIEYGVYPVPKYNLLGKDSFKGLGYVRDIKKVNNKNFLITSFYFNKNDINKKELKDKKNKIFFSIVIPVDSIKNNNDQLSTMISSRNHPNYIAQGSYKNKDLKIDYVAFITADGNSYAIVNMRLFDLNHGNTILINSKKDKSLRSLQIKTPSITKEEVEGYFGNLLREKQVFGFFC
ncbi:hypothetical protein [Leptobacterium sp. I13]|uniref:hypothetical protein n=1 Tax=Leptobacterium meishanense TaxID=3128904 RepID=UPI0030ED22B9